MVLHLIVLLLPFAGGLDTDWESVARQYAQDMRADNDYTVRERAVRLGADFKVVGATVFLCDALDESCAEQQSLERRFAELSQELADVLGQDERLLPVKKRESLAERKIIGERVLREDLFCALIVEFLGKRVDDESRSVVSETVSKARDWRGKLRLMEVAALQKNERAIPAILIALEDKDPRIRMAAADSLALIGAEASVDPLCRALTDKEQPVRYSVITALSALKAKNSIPHLISALAKEEGLLRQNLSVLLEELTGQALGIASESWSKWWSENGQVFLEQDVAPAVVAGPSKDKEDPFSYYGIKTYSKKVIFVLDISDSMNDSAEETVVPLSGIPKRTGNLRPKILVARDHLTQALVALPESATFNIVVYNKYVSTWKPKMVLANKRSKNEAIAYVLNLQAMEATNIMDALDAAFRFGGVSLRDKYYPSEVDTIFFLTDGKATDGRLQDTKEIMAEVKRINKIGKVTLHTIGIGYLHDRPFLETLAKENGGTYVNVQ